LRPEEERDEPIEPLMTSGQTATLTDLEAPSQPVAGKYVGSITVWLEAPSGERYPLPAAAIGHAQTPVDAKADFRDVYLALMRHGEDNYRAVMAVGGSDIWGPAGLTKQERCERWKDRKDLLSSVLRLTCPR
jgi:hypothetical protein